MGIRPLPYPISPPLAVITDRRNNLIMFATALDFFATLVFGKQLSDFMPHFTSFCALHFKNEMFFGHLKQGFQLLQNREPNLDLRKSYTYVMKNLKGFSKCQGFFK